MNIDVVSIPYRYDQRSEGLGAGPEALLATGLINELQNASVMIGVVTAAELDAAAIEPGRTAVNIGHLGARTAELVAAARERGSGVLVLAGDDTAAVGVVAGMQAAGGAGERIGIVWIDAHGDFNTPETSYSGILAGMPVAILAGLAGPLWREAGGLPSPIPTDRILLAGARELDEKEETLLQSTEVRLVRDAQLRDKSTLSEAVNRLANRCQSLVLHVDLDILDPRFVPSASTPSPDGLTVNELIGILRGVLQTGKVAVIALSSLNPGAGIRGQRSVNSAREVLLGTLPAWAETPSAAGKEREG
jgi:arginase